MQHRKTAVVGRALFRLVSTGLALACLAGAASAQTVPPTQPTAAAVPTPVAKPAAAAQPAAGAKAATPGRAVLPAPGTSRCTRLPLSDIQLGREETIASARFRLDEYAASVAKKRGWKGTKKSDETVTCADYLYLPLLGQEYKCLVTATFCPI